MKHQNHVPFSYRKGAMAVGMAIASMATAPALADPLLTIKLFRDSEVMFRDADMSRWAENYVELGVGYNSANSLRFGQFSGLTDEGGFANVGFNWISRDQGNDAEYWQIHGANLGLDSRKIKAEGGVQGRWDASFSFDGLKKSQTESAQFIHSGLGTNNLTLPGLAASLANPQNAGVASRLTPFEIAHGRDIFRAGLKGLLGNEWDYKVSYREDRRDGTRLTGMPFSVSTGTGSSIIVPYSIDDTTSQIEAVLSYATKTAQFQTAYHYSRFTNNLNQFNVQNPWATPGTNSLGRLSLAPSNDLHQVSATGAYNFNKMTRLNASFSHSIGRQNDSFLPYSANGVAANIALLPKGSLEGKVNKTLLEVALTTKPIDKMSLKVAYRQHDDDNRTPIAQFQYASRDAATQGAAVGASTRSNAPVSTTEKRYTVDADYEIAAKTTLRAGLERTDKTYTLSDRTDTRTDKLSIDLRKPVMDDVLGSIGFTHTQRRGSDYDKNVFFRNTYTNATFQAGATGRLTNNPSMRPFMYADFNENRIRGTGSWTVSETLNLQGVVDSFKQSMRGPNCDRFSDTLQSAAIIGALSGTCLGRDSADGSSVSLDLQYQPEENLSTFAFLNVSQTGVKETGRNWARGNATAALDSQNFYSKVHYRDDTTGIGFKWQPQEQWDLGGTYVLNLGRGKHDVTANAGAVVAGSYGAGGSVPDTWSRLHSLQLFAKFDQTKEISWRFNYLYENLRSYDWAVSNLSATSNGAILLTGQQAPRYSNHVFGVSAMVKSW